MTAFLWVFLSGVTTGLACMTAGLVVGHRMARGKPPIAMPQLRKQEQTPTTPEKVQPENKFRFQSS